MIHPDQIFMKRCIELAQSAGIAIKSNPKVGALLVFNGHIIGEGFHEQFGKSHAEINAIENVKPADRYKIPNSTLYVSLEPCSHYGKTPPCAHRIVSEGIKKVNIGYPDPNPIVSGNGINYLKQHGVSVILSELKAECEDLIKKFNVNLTKRPYVILKWAQSADNFFSKEKEQIWLSNKYSRVMAHKWRTECDAIMVGKNTAITDHPQLNVRFFTGDNPMRIIMDSNLQATKYYKDTSNLSKGIVINQLINHSEGNFEFVKVSDTKDLSKIISIFFDRGLSTILVEGGANLINSFIKLGLWDEARVIKTKVKLHNGMATPSLNGKLKNKIVLDKDEVFIIENDNL